MILWVQKKMNYQMLLIPQIYKRILKQKRTELWHRLEKQNRQKRGGGEMTLIWEELGEMLPDRDTPEQHWERRAIAAALERFLRGLTPEERILFLRRYWWAEPVKTAAAHSGISARRAKSILERLRRDLRNELEKEEITL